MAIGNLAEFVRKAMSDKNLSSYDVARRSGGGVSQSTVNKMLNNDVRSHSLETLTALAKGLGVPVDKLISAVRGTPPNPSRFEIYAERFDAHELDITEWQFLESYFNDYVQMYITSKAEREKVMTNTATGSSPQKLAPVVARIDPPTPRTITPEEESEIAERVMPRKKKAS